jgi:hypothetical protein
MTEDRHPNYHRRADDGSGAAVTILEMVLNHESRVDDLEGWQDEVKGMVILAKVALGTSILGMASTIVGMIVALNHHP